MNYEIQIYQDLDGVDRETILLDNGDGSFKSFPADNSNPEFISFLQQAQKENDPYFLTWVEAGNDPDEFWTQAGGSI